MAPLSEVVRETVICMAEVVGSLAGSSWVFSEWQRRKEKRVKSVNEIKEEKTRWKWWSRDCIRRTSGTVQEGRNWRLEREKERHYPLWESQREREREREKEGLGTPTRIPSRLGELGSLFSRYKFLQLQLVVVTLLTGTRCELLNDYGFPIATTRLCLFHMNLYYDLVIHYF